MSKKLREEDSKTSKIEVTMQKFFGNIYVVFTGTMPRIVMEGERISLAIELVDLLDFLEKNIPKEKRKTDTVTYIA